MLSLSLNNVIVEHPFTCPLSNSLKYTYNNVTTRTYILQAVVSAGAYRRYAVRHYGTGGGKCPAFYGQVSDRVASSLRANTLKIRNKEIPEDEKERLINEASIRLTEGEVWVLGTLAHLGHLEE